MTDPAMPGFSARRRAIERWLQRQEEELLYTPDMEDDALHYTPGDVDSDCYDAVGIDLASARYPGAVAFAIRAPRLLGWEVGQEIALNDHVWIVQVVDWSPSGQCMGYTLRRHLEPLGDT